MGRIVDTWQGYSQNLRITFERLIELHGELEHSPRREPMRELISTVLSQRTTHDDEELAYDRMLKRYETWEAVRDADETELAHELRSSRYPETKARNIKAILTTLFKEQGEANIDFLVDRSAEEGMSWLRSLPGVGLKTASLVLLFNFKKPVLPVDTHVHRVCIRLGELPPKTSAEKAHKLLLELLPKDPYILYNFHKALYHHGQRICTYSNPRCGDCPLKDVCKYYKARA